MPFFSCADIQANVKWQKESPAHVESFIAAATCKRMQRRRKYYMTV